MFIKRKSISNVSGVKCFDNKCYYNEAGIVRIDQTEILSEVEGNSFWKLDDNLFFYHDLEGNRIYIETNTREKRKVLHPFFTDSKFQDRILCKANFRRKNRQWLWNLGIFNIKEGSLIKQNTNIINFTVVSSTEKICFGHYKNKSSLHAMSLENLSTEYWAVQLGDQKINKILGTSNDVIYLALNESILEISLSSGEISRRWLDLSGFEIGNDYKDVIPEPSQFSLDKEQEKLIGTFDTFLIEIDLKSGEVNNRDLKVELQSHHISDFRPFRDHPFDDNHIYLTTHTYLPEYPNVDLGSIVALNRKTFKIDWMHTFTDASIGTNTPSITKTHLYQRDTEKNLFIFERVDQPV